MSDTTNVKNMHLVRTSDTDVLVILIGHFYDLLNKFPGIEVEVDFGTGKNRTLYCVRKISMKLGHRKSRAPVFHSFTGTDITSAFRGKGKKSAWSTWDSFEEVTDAFRFIMENHFYPVTADSANFKSLERYTILLYDHTAVTENIIKQDDGSSPKRKGLLKPYHLHK